MMWSLAFVVLMQTIPVLVLTAYHGKNVHITPRNRNMVVQMHNDYRREVDAADMREIVWDPVVAHEAYKWARRCQYVKNEQDVMGENLHFWRGYHPKTLPGHLIMEAIGKWNQEGQNYTYWQRYCGDASDCAYVQMIAAGVKTIGCAMTRCPRLYVGDRREYDATMFICYYSPGTDILHRPPYLRGPKCSSCPSGTECHQQLCRAPDLSSYSAATPRGTQTDSKLNPLVTVREYYQPHTKYSGQFGQPRGKKGENIIPVEQIILPSVSGPKTGRPRDLQGHSKRVLPVTNKGHLFVFPPSKTGEQFIPIEQLLPPTVAGAPVVHHTGKKGPPTIFIDPSRGDTSPSQSFKKSHRKGLPLPIIEPISKIGHRGPVYVPAQLTSDNSGPIIPFKGLVSEGSSKSTGERIVSLSGHSKVSNRKSQHPEDTPQTLAERDQSRSRQSRRNGRGKSTKGSSRRRMRNQPSSSNPESGGLPAVSPESDSPIVSYEEWKKIQIQKNGKVPLFAEPVPYNANDTYDDSILKPFADQPPQPWQSRGTEDDVPGALGDSRRTRRRIRNDPRYYNRREYERQLAERYRRRNYYDSRYDSRHDSRRYTPSSYSDPRGVDFAPRRVMQGELREQEPHYLLSAHNTLRRSARSARPLEWNTNLERWARYVIRCQIEYPGPISCYTNFGKAGSRDQIYNVVYSWGSEGNDVRQKMQYSCRTPHDSERCNHNTIILNPRITKIGCASLDCGLQRQLTCIYKQ